jgi:hypothetical protein
MSKRTFLIIDLPLPQQYSKKVHIIMVFYNNIYRMTLKQQEQDV